MNEGRSKSLKEHGRLKTEDKVCVCACIEPHHIIYACAVLHTWKTWRWLAS